MFSPHPVIILCLGFLAVLASNNAEASMLIAELDVRGQVDQDDRGISGGREWVAKAESSVNTDFDVHHPGDNQQNQANSVTSTEMRTSACCVGVNTHKNVRSDGVPWTLIKPPQNKRSSDLRTVFANYK